MIVAIDPGMTESAIIGYRDGVELGAIRPNAEVLSFLRTYRFPVGSVLVVEQIESYGMAVGREVFETVFWSGRFVEAWSARFAAEQFALVGRKAVKAYLCGTTKAKDANIRQALIDKFGGKSATKKGGALCGVKSHLWAALALAVTFQETRQAE